MAALLKVSRNEQRSVFLSASLYVSKRGAY